MFEWGEGGMGLKVKKEENDKFRGWNSDYAGTCQMTPEIWIVSVMRSHLEGPSGGMGHDLIFRGFVFVFSPKGNRETSEINC